MRETHREEAHEEDGEQASGGAGKGKRTRERKMDPDGEKEQHDMAGVRGSCSG